MPSCGHVAPIPDWTPVGQIAFERTCPACEAVHDSSDLHTLMRPPAPPPPSSS